MSCYVFFCWKATVLASAWKKQKRETSQLLLCFFSVHFPKSDSYSSLESPCGRGMNWPGSDRSDPSHSPPGENIPPCHNLTLSSGRYSIEMKAGVWSFPRREGNPPPLTAAFSYSTVGHSPWKIRAWQICNFLVTVLENWWQCQQYSKWICDIPGALAWFETCFQIRRNI
jgi:hypothetical protein